MKPSLLLIGGGGHCRSCIDVIEMEGTYKVGGILDINERIGEIVLGYKIIGCDDDLREMLGVFQYCLITIGQIMTPEPRIRIYKEIDIANSPVIVSPLAHFSKHACVGSGTIVMHNALINAGAVVGDNCIINSSALIEHDVVIGDHCHVSTSAVVNGNVQIGNGTFVGSNSVIREGVEIGQFVVIGSGVCVKRNVPSNSILAE